MSEFATTRRAALCLTLLALLPIVGCMPPQSHSVRARSGITPLAEPDFDHFANQICKRLSETIETEGYSTPVSITPPIVDAPSVESRSTSVAFSRRLAAAITDRLGMTVRFARPKPDEPALRVNISFAADDDAGPARIVRFALSDADADRVLFEELFTYAAPQRLTSEKVRSDEPIRIDAPVTELETALRRGADAYRKRTIAAPRGRVILLDRHAPDRFEVLAQRTFRMDDGRMRVEFDARSRERDRDARIRVVFYDEDRRVSGSSPVTPYRFQPFDAKVVAFTSPTGAAQHYVVLLESD